MVKRNIFGPFTYLILLIAIGNLLAFDNLEIDSLESQAIVLMVNQIVGSYINFLSDGFILAPHKLGNLMQLNVISTHPLSVEYTRDFSQTTNFVHYTYLGYDRFIEYSKILDYADDNKIKASIYKYQDGIITNDSKYSGQIILERELVLNGATGVHLTTQITSVYVCLNSKVVLLSLSSISPSTYIYYVVLNTFLTKDEDIELNGGSLLDSQFINVKGISYFLDIDKRAISLFNIKDTTKVFYISRKNFSHISEFHILLMDTEGSPNSTTIVFAIFPSYVEYFIYDYNPNTNEIVFFRLENASKDLYLSVYRLDPNTPSITLLTGNLLIHTFPSLYPLLFMKWFEPFIILNAQPDIFSILLTKNPTTDAYEANVWMYQTWSTDKFLFDVLLKEVDQTTHKVEMYIYYGVLSSNKLVIAELGLDSSNNCLFMTSDDDSYCQVYCNPPQIFSSSSKYCQDCPALNYFYKNSCVGTCPLGGSPSGGICSNQDTYIDPQFQAKLINGCKQLTCPIGSIDADSLQYTCDPRTCISQGLYFSKYDCFTQCPPKSNYYISNNICIECFSPNLYVEQQTCKSACSYGWIPDSNFICNECVPPSDYVENNSCVASCSPGWVPDSTDVCHECVAPNDYVQNGVCVSSCSPGFILENDQCSKCVFPTNLYFNNTCVSQCPNGHKIGASETCKDCISPTSFQYNNNCVTDCPPGTYEDIRNCKSCSLPNKFLLNQTCVSTCPTGMIYDQYNECIECVYPTPIIYNNTCIGTCPNGYIEDNLRCIECSSLTPYSINNTCVDYCPAGYVTGNNTCSKCSASRKYLFNNTCLQECPSRTGYNESLDVCSSCKATDYSLKISTVKLCLQQCPEGYIGNSSTLVCEEESACLPNPCQNNSTCLINKNDEYYCICQAGFRGVNCDDPNADSRELADKILSELVQLHRIEMNSDGDLMPITYTYMSNFIDLIKDIPGEMLYEIDKLVYDIANKITEEMLSGKVQYNKDSMKVADAALFAKSKVYRASNSTELENQYLDEMEKMKIKVIGLLDLQEFQNKTHYSNLTTISYLQSDEYLSDEALLNARLNNISIVNFTNCENLLRQNNLIGENDRIIINQLEFGSQIANKSNETISGTSVHYKFLNIRTNEPVNTSVCKNSIMTVLIPMDAELLGLNLTEIVELQENGLYNVFDKQDQLFNDVCLSYIQNSTDSDTTVDYRRKNYFQNYSVECKPKNISSGSIIDASVECTFEGVDNFGFIRCDCEFAGDLQVDTKFKHTILEDFIKWNVEIVACYSQFLVKDNLSKNIGFIMIALFILIPDLIVFVFLYCYEGKYLIDNMVKILDTDCSYNKGNQLPELIANNMVGGLDDNDINENNEPGYRQNTNSNDINSPSTKLILTDNYKAQQTPEIKGTLQNSIRLSESQPLETKILKIKLSSPSQTQDIEKKKQTRKAIIKKEQGTQDLSHLEIEVAERDLRISSKNNIKFNVANRDQSSRQVFFNNYMEGRFISDKKIRKANPHTDNLRFPAHFKPEDRLNFTLNKFSSKDFKRLSNMDKLEYDKRTGCEYFQDLIKYQHSILSLYFVKSIMSPIHLRILHYFASLSLLFLLNALAFSDEYINSRANFNKKSSPFLYVLVNEIGKSLIANVGSNIFCTVMILIIHVPRKFDDEFNEYLIKEDIVQIKIGLKIFKKRMCCRFTVFIILHSILIFFTWYYVTVFCNVYRKSSLGLLYGSIVSLVIQSCGLGLLVPILMIIFRNLAKKYKKKQLFLKLHQCSYYLKYTG